MGVEECGGVWGWKWEIVRFETNIFDLVKMQLEVPKREDFQPTSGALPSSTKQRSDQAISIRSISFCTLTAYLMTVQVDDVVSGRLWKRENPFNAKNIAAPKRKHASKWESVNVRVLKFIGTLLSVPERS